MKKFTIKGVLDGIRGSVSQQPKTEVDYVEETLRPEHFQVMKVKSRLFDSFQSNCNLQGAFYVLHIYGLRPRSRKQPGKGVEK